MSTQDEEQSHSVKLYVYDLSQGLAKQLSSQIIGREIEAVYHTSIVVHGKEYFFSRGIRYCQPGTTHYGVPVEVLELPLTYITEEILTEYLRLLESEFTQFNYDLFEHNCNHFSNELSQFLCGENIPEKILDLPSIVLSTPMGQLFSTMLKSQFSNIATTVTNDHLINDL